MRIGEIERVGERVISLPTHTPPARPEPSPSPETSTPLREFNRPVRGQA